MQPLFMETSATLVSVYWIFVSNRQRLKFKRFVASRTKSSGAWLPSFQKKQKYSMNTIGRLYRSEMHVLTDESNRKRSSTSLSVQPTLSNRCRNIIESNLLGIQSMTSCQFLLFFIRQIFLSGPDRRAGLLCATIEMRCWEKKDDESDGVDESTEEGSMHSAELSFRESQASTHVNIGR